MDQKSIKQPINKTIARAEGVGGELDINRQENGISPEELAYEKAQETLREAEEQNQQDRR